MRPIKFRGWYKNEKLMFPIAEITFHKDWDIIAFPLTREAISSYLVWGNVVLMQSTWLKDKNGRDIYEWDIVKIEDECYGVYRDEEYLEYYIMNGEDNEPMYSYAHYEVIGNIYENPELVNA